MPMNRSYRYIAIEGPIGVGKSTLAQRLASRFGGHALLEAPERNPFLASFYRDPARHALATQLSFLMERVHELAKLRQPDMFAPLVVADHIFEKDEIFARLNLSDEEFKLYRQIADLAALDLPKPDLVIYLQAPVNELKRRVHKRGRDYESNLTDAYLERLSAAYVDFFYHFHGAPLLIVNTNAVDFANRDRDFEMLLQQLETGVSGRSYLNLKDATKERTDADENFLFTEWK